MGTFGEILPYSGPASSYVKGDRSTGKTGQHFKRSDSKRGARTALALQPQIETTEGKPHPFNPFLFII